MQDSTCAPSGPLIEQSASDSVQWRPAGRSSLSVTPVAVPWPMFSTLIEKVAVSPALMLAPSGVLVTLTSGHRTWIDADAESVPSLVVVASPVLSTGPQLAAVVGLKRWTW